MMNTEYFKKVVNMIESIVGSNGTVHYQEIQKNNGQTKHGISILYDNQKNSNVVPALYMDEYVTGDVHADAVKIITTYGSVLKTNAGVKYNGIEKIILDYEKASQLVYPKIVSYEKNIGTLNKCVHKDFLDLAVIYTVRLNDVSVTVTKEILEKWDISEDRLYTVAMKNLLKDRYTIESIVDKIYKMSGYRLDTPFDMLYISNSSYINGAAECLNDDAMEEALDTLGTDKMVVIPSSIHEVIVVPYDENINDINAIVEEVNRTVVSAEDVLSGHIYYYDKKHGMYM